MMMILAALVGIGALTGLSILTAVCICAGVKYVPEKSDCIIVLGARVRPDGGMSDTLRYRCETALSAWQNGVAPAIIVCGGRGDDEPYTEAAVMKKWLMDKGVPDHAVLSENQSGNTRENMENARLIMVRRGFLNAARCTSDYHMKRALWIARAAGVEACGIAAPSPDRFISRVAGRLRETVSWTLYFLKMI